MKKLITLFLVCLTIIAQTYTIHAASFNAVVESKKANVGDEVEIRITLENNSGIIAALFNMEYDRERLELIEVTDAQLLEGGTFSPNYRSYPYRMVWNSASNTNFTNNGTLAVLKFKVLDSAQAGNAFINLSYREDDVFDVNLNNVDINVKNGSVEVIAKTTASSAGTVGGSLLHGQPGTSGSESENIMDDQIILTIGQNEALVFGKAKANDVPPIIRNERTMLPARFVAENLGAQVDWDGERKKVIIIKGDIEIIVTIDSQTAFVNGAAIVLDSPAFIENDRTYTPLRFIAEKLGASVAWDGNNQKVTISK